MTHHSSKSYSFYRPPSLTEPLDDYSTSRALSRLKADGHGFIRRISSNLRRTKSQYNLSGISSASNLEKSKALEHKHSTANLRECDSRYEAARYLKRREQIQLVSATDPRHRSKKSSANLGRNNDLQPTLIAGENTSEKKRWISGLKHYLSTRNKENDPVNHHKKCKSIPASTFGRAVVSDTSQQGKLSDSSYTSILVNKHSSKSLRYTTIRKSPPFFVDAKPQPLQMHESEISASNIPDQRQISSYLMSSNITVKSEDLTAKEFAYITGIKICSDDEISEVNLATVKSNCLSQKTSSGFGDEELHSIQSLQSTPHTTVHSTYNRKGSSDWHSRSSSTKKKLQIWEQEFWSSVTPLPTNCSRSGSQEDIQARIALYPLSKSKSLHDHYDSETKSIPRRSNTTNNVTSPLAKRQDMSNSDAQSYPEVLPDVAILRSTSQSQPPVLRRGRFQITIENALSDCHLADSTRMTHQNQLSHTSSQHSTLKTDKPELLQGDIIEWKRKRK